MTASTPGITLELAPPLAASPSGVSVTDMTVAFWHVPVMVRYDVALMAPMTEHDIAVKVTADLLEHGKAVWPSIGTFELVSKLARSGTDPETGELVMVAARVVVRFTSVEVESIASLPQVDWFGAFSKRTYEAYIGRLPTTGERVEVLASATVIFSPSAQLKANIQAAKVTAPEATENDC